jgi:hypothetical protein
MPNPTVLQCPHCGNAAKVTKVIPLGAKITCTRCRKQFPFRPSGNGTAEDHREEVVGSVPLEEPEDHREEVVDSIPLEELLASEDRDWRGGRPGQGGPGLPLRELLASDDRASRSFPSDDEPRGRYQSVSNTRLDPNPLAPAAESSKLRLIGGKQVRFGTSRQYTAVFLTFVLAATGYCGFWGLVSLWKYIQAQSDVAENYRNKLAEGVKAKDKKKGLAEGVKATDTKKGVVPAEPAPPPTPPVFVQADAGKPVQSNDWEVCVETAQLVKVDPASPAERLVITLRITNNSLVRRPYRYWSKPGKNTVIRNQNLSYLNLIPGTAPNEEERGMNPKETIRDFLVLESLAARFELDLNLLLPSGNGGFNIHVPSTFVTRVE